MTEVRNIAFQDYDVYIGRRGTGKDGYFGNPFVIGKDGNRKQVIDKYKEYFYQRLINDSEFKKRILELKDKRLGCFCYPEFCHGDIIKEYLDNE